MKLNKIEESIVEDSVNHYWNWVVSKLDEKNLGDIERKNLENTKEILDDLLERFYWLI